MKDKAKWMTDHHPTGATRIPDFWVFLHTDDRKVIGPDAGNIVR
jgi:hypothetical protein